MNNDFKISMLSIAKYLLRGLLQRGRLWHFWYLGALIIAYCLISLLCKLLYSKDGLFQNDRLVFFWLVLLVLSVGVQIVSYFVGEPIQKKITQTFRIWSWIHYLLMGGVLGSPTGKQILSKLSTKKHAVAFVLFSIIVIVSQNILGKFVIHNTFAEYFYDDPCMILWVFLLVSFILRIDIKQKYGTIIERYTPLTFGVYLIHPLILDVVKKVGITFSAVGAFAYWILLTVVCFCFMDLLYRNRHLRKLFTL